LSSNKRITNTEPIHPKANNVDLVKRALNFEINDFETGYHDSYSNTIDIYICREFKKIFEKIYPLVKELDKLLSDRPHLEIINTVAEIIIFSLMSSNPVKFLKDAINFHH